MKLFFATNNLNKQREIKEILLSGQQKNLELLFPADFNLDKMDVEENGSSFRENALIKASAFYKMTGITTAAEDSGLEIDALNGMPGILSARFSGIHGDDKANRMKVLKLMKNIPPESRNARFVANICVFNGISAEYFEGVCPGRIAYEEKGFNGFGYDPIFIPEGYDTTFAEMTSEQKNAISHRRKALIKLKKFIY